MMKVLLFGMVAEKVGQQSTTLQGDMMLGDLIAEVGCADVKPLLVAVNQEQVNDKGKGEASLYLGEGEKS